MAKKKTTSSKKSPAAAVDATKSTQSGSQSGDSSADSKSAASKSAASKRATKAAAKKRRTTRHTDSWSALSSAEIERYFVETPPADILDAFEQSYTSDVANVLLDLRRSAVRQLFEGLASVRKRGISTLVTLYHYRIYLMNPLPLSVGHDRTPNYYAILGVPRDADVDDIKLAHRLLVKAHDSGDFSPPMRPFGEVRLAEIDDAFRHLHPEEKRSQSDQILPNIHYLYPRRDQSWLEATQRILE